MTKTIFITGASTGLGKATAKLFAQFIPEERRGSANGWVAAGLSIGPAIGFCSRCRFPRDANARRCFECGHSQSIA